MTQKKFSSDEEFFKGHFPGNPVLPGVIQCETVFQTGALLMSYLGEQTGANQTALVTRIQNAKFKNIVKPEETLTIEVELTEKLANAAFMKGKITSGEKTIMTIDFSCAIVSNAQL